MENKSKRESFVKEFGEKAALAIEAAAQEHAYRPEEQSKASDPFLWAILQAIGFQCFEVTAYRKHHGIRPSYKRIREWISKKANLENYKGDIDYLALMAGAYSGYVKK